MYDKLLDYIDSRFDARFRNISDSLDSTLKMSYAFDRLLAKHESLCEVVDFCLSFGLISSAEAQELVYVIDDRRNALHSDLWDIYKSGGLPDSVQ